MAVKYLHNFPGLKFKSVSELALVPWRRRGELAIAVVENEENGETVYSCDDH